MLFIFMAYFATLLIFLFSGSWIFSETIIIKQFYSTSVSSNLAEVRRPAWYYSSNALIQSNNPFPYNLVGYPLAEFNQILKDRFYDVVGIPETMIAEGPFGNRPFFFNIDRNLLPILSRWEWGGAYDYPLQAAGYTVPSAQGYFNQTEQRFYVSDGRQYQVVPEPTSFSLLLAGLVLLINSRRLKNAIN